MDWKKALGLAKAGGRAVRALGNSVMATVEKRVIDPTTELEMTLKKIRTDRAAINRQAIELSAQTIQLQQKQQQLRDDIALTHARIAALLKAGNRPPATILAGVLAQQQRELQAVGKRLWQSVLQAQEIAAARDLALQRLQAHHQQIKDRLAEQPVVAAKETIAKTLAQWPDSLSAPAALAMMHLDTVAALTETQVTQGVDTTIAEADADALIRRFEAEQALTAAEAATPPDSKT